MTRTLLFLLASVGLHARAADILDTHHIDLATNYNAALNIWQLTLRNADDRIEYAGRTGAENDRVIVRGGIFARAEVPADARYAFLGSPGTPVWVLPQTQDPELPYLGISTENRSTQTDWVGNGVATGLLTRGIASGVFTGNRITLSLASVSGPGNFFMYGTDASGNATVLFDSADGISAADSRLFVPALHEHFNWAFSAPGEYDVTLVASGTLSVGAFSQSAPTSFRFSIVPEPGSAAFAVLGALVLTARRRAHPHSVHHQ